MKYLAKLRKWGEFDAADENVPVQVKNISV